MDVLMGLTQDESGSASFGIRRLKQKIPEILLRLVRLSDPGLQEIRESFLYPLGKRRPVVTPTPNGHPAHPEVTSSRGIAAEYDFEQEIMPTAGQAALEAR